MKIAILIGVSEFDTLKNLPPCKNDLMTMKKLIEATGSYDQIISISENTNSDQIRKNLSKLKSFQDKRIEEVFFYYTGHGYFYSDQFHYSCSNSDLESLDKTFLSNNEVDNLIKLLNPSLTVKVVDACQAGVRYVKNIDSVEEDLVENYLKDSQVKFNDCYFMFSSDIDQCSTTFGHLSVFTRSFFNAIRNHTSSEIRFGQIMDHIANEFKSTNQTPIFISQGPFYHVFCQINQKIIDLFDENEDLFYPNSTQTTMENNNGNSTSSAKDKNKINELILKLQSRNNILGECIAEAFTIAQTHNDVELADFCKKELTGWEDERIPKDDMFKYRDQEFICSFKEMNLDLPLWEKNPLNMLSYMENNPTKYPKVNIFSSTPISILEKSEIKDPEKKLIMLKMPAERLVPDYHGSIKHLYCYAKPDIYKNLAEKIRIKLTEKLINLLDKIN